MEEQPPTSKPRRPSFVQQGENPLADGASEGAGAAEKSGSFRIENLANAKSISAEELEELLAALTALDNKARLATIEERKRPYLFSASQLLQVLRVTESVKTRIAIVQQLGPRLTDPRNKTEILALFRFSDEKRQVEDVLKAREQFLSKSQFVPPSGRLSVGGRGPAGRGRGRGGSAGRCRVRGAPTTAAATAVAAVASASQGTDDLEEEPQSTSTAAAAAAVAAPTAASTDTPAATLELPKPPSIAKLFLPVDAPEQVVASSPAPCSPVHAVTPPPSPHAGTQPQPALREAEAELTRADDVQFESNGQAAGYEEAAVLTSLGLPAERAAQMPEVWEQQVASAPAAAREGDAGTDERLSHALQSLGLTRRDAMDMLEAWEVAALQREAGSTALPDGNGSLPWL